MAIRLNIKTSALAGMEKALNAYLKLDPVAMERMAALAGKEIAIELSIYLSIYVLTSI